MHIKLGRLTVWLLSIVTLGAPAARSQETTLPLWTGTAPGKSVAAGNEKDTTGPDGRLVAGKPVIRLGNVANPTLTVFSPPADKNTGAAVLVCPGGGYHILAYDLEGTEVCEWLNSIGVTGVLLKYRVPRSKNQRIPDEPLMDAQRAMSMIRAHAEEWGIQTDRIGVLGFSAGGNLAARLSTSYQKRAYQSTDSMDQQSCRPDFAVLIYPAYLYDDSENGRNRRGKMNWVNLPVDAKTPPMFLTMAFDDPVKPENILRMGIALKQNDVPVELHLYPTGGHGYGLRPNDHAATTWPAACQGWMQASGWLTK